MFQGNWAVENIQIEVEGNKPSRCNKALRHALMLVWPSSNRKLSEFILAGRHGGHPDIVVYPPNLENLPPLPTERSPAKRTYGLSYYIVYLQSDYRTIAVVNLPYSPFSQTMVPLGEEASYLNF